MTVRALLRLAAAGAVAVAALAGCGSGDDEGGAARRRPQPVGSTITVGGLDYRVVIGRQINPRTPPGDSLVTSPDGGERRRVKVDL